MRVAPINLLGGFYADDSLPWSAQDTVNYIPEAALAPDTRTATKLRGAPGLKPSVQFGTRALRGARNVEGKLFVVTDKLYQISNTDVAIPLGTIPGSGLVAIGHNQISGGNEILVANGSAGYVYNTKTEIFERVTDPGYPGAIAVDYIDSYLVQVEPFGRFWFHSDLADAKAYNTLDRYESEASPDPIVTLKVSNFEVVVFNKTTTEFFYNAGGATGTFQSKRIVIKRGCAGRNSVAELDNSLFWLGDDGVVYRLDGYQARPISTPPIDKAISGCNWANAIAYTYESEGHKVYYLTFPDGKTWGYDVTTQLWHRRESFGFNRWRINTLTYWDGDWIAGDFQASKLYTVDWDYMLEGADPLVSERVSGVTHANQNRVSCPMLELIYDTGHPETVPVVFPEQPDGPTITGSAPDGSLGVPYAGFTYTVTPGDAAIVSVEVVSGALPSGLTMDNEGEIDTGTPTAIASYTVTLRVTDANGLWDEHTDTIAINAVSFAVPVTNAGIVHVSGTGLDWSSTVDSGLGEDVVLLSAAGGFVFAIGDGVGRYSDDSGGTWGDMVGLLGAQPPLAMAYSEVEGETVWLLSYTSGTSFSRSTDGVNFSTVTTDVGRSWGGAAGIEATFVVTGSLGNGAISTDAGLTFEDSVIHPSSSIDISQIIATSNGFVAVDTLGNFLTSSTGLSGSWTANAGPFGATGTVTMCEHDDRLIVLNDDSSFYSEDNCATWVAGGELTGELTFSDRNIVHNGIRFIVGIGNGINISPDGAVWSSATGTGAGAAFRVASLGNNS
jgi:hypothetical protein